MPVSRIAFALHDAVQAIKALHRADPDRAGFAVEFHLDPRTFEAVVRELEYHFGAKLQRDPHVRGAMKYSGARLVPILPGNRPLMGGINGRVEA